MPKILDQLNIADPTDAQRFETNFLAVYPKPANFGGTNAAWLRHVVVSRLKQINKTGAEKLAAPDDIDFDE